MKKINHVLLTDNYTEVLEEENTPGTASSFFIVKNINTKETLSKIYFQKGPIKENGINGIQNEDLLIMVCRRLEEFQFSPYGCRENQKALEHIYESLMWLRKRTNQRILDNKEGTSKI